MDMRERDALFTASVEDKVNKLVEPSSKDEISEFYVFFLCLFACPSEQLSIVGSAEIL